MFESICIRNQSQSQLDVAIDLGFLAESMIFYSDVLVIASEEILAQLAKACGPETLIELTRLGHLRLKFEYEQTAIVTKNTGTANERHSAAKFSSPDHALQHLAPRLFTQIVGKSGKGRRLANRFMKIVEIVDRGPDALSDFASDVLDRAYLQAAVRQLIQYFAPEYSIPDPLVFEVHEASLEYVVETNIDFLELNRSYHLHVPPSHSSLSPAYLLSHILTARDNLYFASTTKADLALNPISSQILVTKVDSILDRYNKDASQIAKFQDFLFNDGKAIGQAIRSGQKSFADLLRVLERADRFRSWLKNKPADTDLAKDYFKEVTQASWIDKLPAKNFRWALFTGAGLLLDTLGGGGLGTAIGVGISAADSFLLDRLMKGWKPNQFIDGPARTLINDH